MKYIKKRESPDSLEEYKLTDGASFKDLHKNHTSIKRQVKNSLMAEQGYICCYCGRRINSENMSIEHFKPKAENLFPELQLEYSNLLASCQGGRSERVGKDMKEKKKYPLSCDAKKKNIIIEVCPTDPRCESYFEYDEDGEIYGVNAKAKYAIEILGLNNNFLKNGRKAAIDTYKDLPDKTDWSSEIDFLSRPNRDGQYEPYCFAVIYYIQHYKMIMLAA